MLAGGGKDTKLRYLVIQKSAPESCFIIGQAIVVKVSHNHEVTTLDPSLDLHLDLRDALNLAISWARCAAYERRDLLCLTWDVARDLLNLKLCGFPLSCCAENAQAGRQAGSDLVKRWRGLTKYSQAPKRYSSLIDRQIPDVHLTPCNSVCEANIPLFRNDKRPTLKPNTSKPTNKAPSQFPHQHTSTIQNHRPCSTQILAIKHQTSSIKHPAHHASSIINHQSTNQNPHTKPQPQRNNPHKS